MKKPTGHVSPSPAPDDRPTSRATAGGSTEGLIQVAKVQFMPSSESASETALGCCRFCAKARMWDTQVRTSAPLSLMLRKNLQTKDPIRPELREKNCVECG